MTAQKQFEFAKALSALFEGTLSEADGAQLIELLAEDGEAFAYYMRLVRLDVGLQWSFGTRSEREVLATDSAIIAAPTKDSCSNPARRFEEPANTRPSALILQTGRFFSRPILLYVALVALCLYGSFVLVAWNLRPDKLPSFAAGGSDSVAVVRDTTDVQWVSKSAESSVLPGEPLQIKSGTIELELKAGTKLVVEGPADWSIDGDNHATLRWGRLAARVPPQAIGFTVETPTGRIIDLGTEFEVQVSPSGATDIQVAKGKVELYPDVKHGVNLSTQQRKITLVAGTARRIEIGAAGEVTDREIAHRSPRLSSAAGSSRAVGLSIAGAKASSESDIQQVKCLIDGSGLQGDRHSNIADGTMWRSAPRTGKAEFVLFDLGRLSRLKSMKVWNYNQAHATSRGVTHADIYVSVSGIRDPLKQPTEWTRVVSDFNFAKASGTSDYDTPDTIVLGNSTARFVAIVILDPLDPKAGGAFPSKDSVGMSEVQFFGARLTIVNGDINHKNGTARTFTGTGAAGGGFWNPIDVSGIGPATASGTNLVASDGATPTDVDFTATGAKASGDIGTSDSNTLNPLLDDYLWTNGTDFAIGTFQFKDLAVGGVYDIYLYGSAGNYNQRSIFSITGYGSQTESLGSSSATTTVVPVGDLNLTYVKFATVVADANGEINGTWTNNPGFFAGPFNGFQLVLIERP